MNITFGGRFIAAESDFMLHASNSAFNIYSAFSHKQDYIFGSKQTAKKSLKKELTKGEKFDNINKLSQESETKTENQKIFKKVSKRS